MGAAVRELRQRGICDTCHDLVTGAPYGARFVLHEDDRFRVTLEEYPRARGHTIVIYKPHRADLTELGEEEAGLVFRLCVRVAQAIKRGLGAEKVYLNTMCDGSLNYFHLQLIPSYAGDPIGSKRFVAARGPLVDGAETTRLIRAALAEDASGSTDAKVGHNQRRDELLG